MGVSTPLKDIPEPCFALQVRGNLPFYFYDHNGYAMLFVNMCNLFLCFSSLLLFLITSFKEEECRAPKMVMIPTMNILFLVMLAPAILRAYVVCFGTNKIAKLMIFSFL